MPPQRPKGVPIEVAMKIYFNQVVVVELDMNWAFVYIRDSQVNESNQVGAAYDHVSKSYNR